MPRKLRIEYAGAIYHLMSRGDRREAIYRNDVEQAEEGLGENHSGEQRLESAVAKGERVIARELGCLGWKREDLAARRQSDPEKVAIAMRLRRETTLTIEHLASRLSLGMPKSASQGQGPVTR